MRRILPHCVVLMALTYGVVLKAEEAQIALIDVSRGVLVLFPSNRNNRKIVVDNIDEIVSARDSVAANGREGRGFVWVYRYGGRKNGYCSFPVRQFPFTDGVEPFVGFIERMLAIENLTLSDEVKSGGLSEINKVHAYENFLGDVEGQWFYRGLPYIRSLVENELIVASGDGISGQNCLPDHYESVNRNQYDPYFRPKYLFVLASLVLCTFSIVLLFKVLDKVHLDPRFNVNVAVCVFFLSLCIFVGGGMTLLTVLGLTTGHR
jgi:hypothetical protein